MVFAQQPRKFYEPTDFDETYYGQFEQRKRIPKEIRVPVLLALSHYPQLKDKRIAFRLRKRRTPLTSRPRILSALLPKAWRAYVITISTKTTKTFSPILFKKLPFNAKIGVLGHEIAHVLDYKERTSLQIMGLAFRLGNSDFVDRFEFQTDAAAIEQGLGYQLLDWSIFVRRSLNVQEWKGASKELESGNALGAQQRYMNPATIRAYMKKNPIYID